MPKDQSRELVLLKVILWTYIILCIILAGLNYGYVKSAPESVGKAITWFWHFYENWIKTLFIVLASMLTLKIIRHSRQTEMRKRNLKGLIITALIVHILSPIMLNNSELYFFAMPLPWTTTPLQMLFPDSSFFISRFPLWGATGVTTALIFYGLFSVVVFVGTVLLGRRWQCSTLCLFNGFASEVFAPAFPLIGKQKAVQPKHLKLLTIMKWFMFTLALFFTLYWIFLLSGIVVFEDYNLIGKLEIYKYLSAELLLMMFFWIAFTGRGYCYYCPLGTLLGGMGKIFGQKIITNQTKCLNCGQCNQACPMAIDLQRNASKGKSVASLRCVGCGHCVDACPAKTLSYTTTFLTYQTVKFKSSDQ